MTPTTSAPLFTEITVPDLALWQVAAILLVCLPLALLLGFAAGRAKRRRPTDEGVEKVAGETAMNAFLTLFGLLLAFTFGNALNVSESIKSAITNEAAALGTAFLRADYLAEPGRTALQTALLDYARTRVVSGHLPIDTEEKATAFLETSLSAQAKLWPLTLEATQRPETPPAIQAFVAGAMNEALDAHLFRLATLSVPISSFTQWVALAGGVLALFLVGDRLAMLGHALTWQIFVFALFLAAVMYTVVDIRRSAEGLVVVDDSALDATIFDMEQALASRR